MWTIEKKKVGSVKVALFPQIHVHLEDVNTQTLSPNTKM